MVVMEYLPIFRIINQEIEEYIDENYVDIINSISAYVATSSKITDDCCVCLEKKLLYKLQCNHNCVCHECCIKISKCPLCRDPFITLNTDQLEDYFTTETSSLFVHAEWQVRELLKNNNLETHNYLEMCQWLADEYGSDHGCNFIDMCSTYNGFVNGVIRNNIEIYCSRLTELLQKNIDVNVEISEVEEVDQERIIYIIFGRTTDVIIEQLD
jgi:hypothetical protein